MNEKRRSSDVEMALLMQDMAEMKKSMDSLQGQVRQLLEAWNTASGLVKFVKWMAGLVTAVTVLWTAINHWPK